MRDFFSIGLELISRQEGCREPRLFVNYTELSFGQASVPILLDSRHHRIKMVVEKDDKNIFPTLFWFCQELQKSLKSLFGSKFATRIFLQGLDEQKLVTLGRGG